MRFGFIIFLTICSSAYAELAMTKFSLEGNIHLQLSVDGSIINSTPKKSVTIKSGAGIKTIGFRLIDVCGNVVDECYEDLFIKSGLISDFKLVVDDCGISHLKLLNESLMYVERLRKPDQFYNDTQIAMRPSYLSPPCSAWVTRV